MSEPEAKRCPTKIAQTVEHQKGKGDFYRPVGETPPPLLIKEGS